MLMALTTVQESLEGLVDVRCKDEAWDDDGADMDMDMDMDYAVDLVLAYVKKLACQSVG